MQTQQEQNDQVMKVIVFQLLDGQFGVDVRLVSSIERVIEITNVPRAQRFVKGVIHLRGSVIPVVDLKERLLSIEQQFSDDARIILLNLDGYEIGIIVDAASDVIDIPLREIQPPPRMMAGVQMEYLQGIVKLPDKLLMLLDLSKALDLKEIEQIFQGEDLSS